MRLNAYNNNNNPLFTVSFLQRNTTVLHLINIMCYNQSEPYSRTAATEKGAIVLFRF